MTRRFAIAIAALFVASSAFAQALPPGKWWRRPEIVQSLALSDEQQDRLEGIFRASAPDLIDLKAEVDKANIALRGELAAGVIQFVQFLIPLVIVYFCASTRVPRWTGAQPAEARLLLCGRFPLTAEHSTSPLPQTHRPHKERRLCLAPTRNWDQDSRRGAR